MTPARQAALVLGASITAALSTSYLGLSAVVCCLPVWAGALAAVWKYTNDTQTTLRPSEGAVLGLQAVAAGLAIGMVLSLILRLVGIRDDLMMADWVMNRMGGDMSPEQAAQFEAQLERTPLQSFFSLSNLFGYLLMSGLGGLAGMLGAAIFKKGGEQPSY